MSNTYAQSSRDQAEALALYRQTNAAATAPGLRKALSEQTMGLLDDGQFRLGALRTFDNRRRPVPGLRYHAGLRLLEVQDSLGSDTTHLWPVGSLRGFDLGEVGDPENPLRRFRPRLVKEGLTGTPRREFVEVLTTVDAGPLLLAWLYTPGPDPEKTGRRPLVQVLVAGPGVGNDEPLRPVALTKDDVLKLFGKRGEEVRSFAAGQRLTYDKATDVARMVDYFNRVALAK
ncbi:hypothetical protein GCM10023185_03430 [Hymenobacter saemangeumensis]|uniref:Uncharacterized protein n=1 Tax=Hymenobacter saemangeumensis TaxID=1084522 RepID=A0ABP8HZ71_9BACT